MTTRYETLVKELCAAGVDFTADPFNRDRGTDWEQLAKEYGYRRPKTAYFSRGGCFYMLLQKVYNKMNRNK